MTRVLSPTALRTRDPVVNLPRTAAPAQNNRYTRISPENLSCWEKFKQLLRRIFFCCFTEQRTPPAPMNGRVTPGPIHTHPATPRPTPPNTTPQTTAPVSPSDSSPEELPLPPEERSPLQQLQDERTTIAQQLERTRRMNRPDSAQRIANAQNELYRIDVRIAELTGAAPPARPTPSGISTTPSVTSTTSISTEPTAPSRVFTGQAISHIPRDLTIDVLDGRGPRGPSPFQPPQITDRYRLPRYETLSPDERRRIEEWRTVEGRIPSLPSRGPIYPNVERNYPYTAGHIRLYPHAQAIVERDQYGARIRDLPPNLETLERLLSIEDPYLSDAERRTRTRLMTSIGQFDLISPQADIASEGLVHDARGLQRRPPPLRDEPRPDNFDAIPFTDWLRHFDRLHDLTTASYADRMAIQGMRNRIAEFVNFIETVQEDGPPGYHGNPTRRIPGYRNDIQFAARWLIVQMNTSAPLGQPISADMRGRLQAAFTCLADALDGCPPRKQEEIVKILINLRLFSRSTRLPGCGINESIFFHALITKLSNCKDDIPMELFQGGQFHILNFIRNLYGDQWGLSHMPLANDPHQNGCGAMQHPDYASEALEKLYTPKYAVQKAYEFITNNRELADVSVAALKETFARIFPSEADRRAFEETYLEAEGSPFATPASDAVTLMKTIRARVFNADATPATDSAGQPVYNSYSTLNERGVAFLLTMLGFLTPAPREAAPAAASRATSATTAIRC